MRRVFLSFRNSSRAKRRGWIVSASASVDMSVNVNAPPQRIVISWENSPDDDVGGPLLEHEPLAKP